MTDTGDQTCAQLETLFHEIEQTRMDGVPILNDRLSVAAFGFEPFGDYLTGVLLTPWFMNLMLLPVNQPDGGRGAYTVGQKHLVALPAGQVEFIVGHEEVLGFFLACSLFSPVLEFEDQAVAEQTAMAVLDEVLTASGADRAEEQGEEAADDANMRDIWEGRLPQAGPAEEPQLPTVAEKVSRRELLRGKLTRDDAA